MLSQETPYTRMRRTLPVLQSPEQVFIQVSENSKTGQSINFPIALTCSPTKACRSYCYATAGHIAMPHSVKAQVRSHAALLHADAQPDRDARFRIMAQDVVAQIFRSTFLRWNGSGDLFPAAVRLLNAVMRETDKPQWVITRKPRMAAKLDDVPQLRLLLSLDSTTPPKKAAAMRQLVRTFQKAAVRLAWVRSTEDEPIPDDIDIIFHWHKLGHPRRFKSTDARVCPATLPGSSHHNSCENCRRCFSQKAT